MNPTLFENLIAFAKANAINQIEKLQNQLAAIDILLNSFENRSKNVMVTGDKRRKGLVAECKKALSVIGQGSIRDITNQIINTHPLGDDMQLMSKVATHMKRLHDAGEVSVEKNGRCKSYKLITL